MGVEVFPVTHRSGYIGMVCDDIRGRFLDCSDDVCIPDGSCILTEPNHVRKHFIRFTIGYFFNTAMGTECAQNTRSTLAFNGRDNRVCEHQVALLTGPAIEEDNGFKYTGRCHPDMRARIEKLLWLRRKFCIQQVTNLAAGIEGNGVSRPTVRLQKTNQTVFV